MVNSENDLAPVQGPATFLDEALASDATAAEELVDFERPMRWRGRVGALLLNRSDPETYRWSEVFPFVMTYGQVYLDHPLPKFHFPLSSSVDVALRRSGDTADVDFRYFGVQQATANTGLVHGDRQTIYFPWPPTLTPVSVEASLASTLQSAELNLSGRVSPNIAVSTGFRYLQFREALIANETISSFDHNDRNDWRAQNELFGWQIGLETLLLTIGDRWRFDAAAHAGVFGNAASSKLVLEFSNIGWQFTNDVDAYRGSVAFVGDVNLSAAFQVTPHVALRGGYQLLWLSGVATATDQLQNWDNDYFRTYTDSHVFFHGAMVGLEGTW